MSVNYVCKHCHTLIGCIDSDECDDIRLGFHRLTDREREQYIRNHLNGDITVRMTCDYCAEAYASHPELAGLTSPLQ